MAQNLRNLFRHKNPFNFPRKWEKEVGHSDFLQQLSSETEITEIKRLLTETLMLFEHSFEKKLQTTLLSFLNDQKETAPLSKGKGRGKRSKTVPKDDPPQSTSNATPESIQRLKTYIEQLECISNREKSTSRASVSESLYSCERDPAPNSEKLTAKKTIFIRKVECQLNTNPIDQLEDDGTLDQNMSMYFRMFYYNGQMNSMFSNGISYEDFMNGYYFAVFDLSTSGKSGSSYLVPSIRVAHLRLRILFSEALPNDLTM